MIIFKKARSPTQTLNDLDAYLKAVGTEPIKLLAREVQSWSEFSYDELADLIADGRLDDYLDWQARYSALIAGTLAPLWSDAITAASRKATAGKVVLFDSNDYVRAWLETHGGELITQLSRESQKAVAMVIMLGQSQRMAPRDIAKQVRPLIGLTQNQATANLNYREKVYNQLRENGMSEAKARARADKAAIRYAGKQHRFRAETIVHTELAFAYNRGAHMGVSQGIAEGLMGRCAMKWSTAGTNRVCSRCLALKDTIVGYTDESGVTIPPLHPRCRCAIIYDEVAAPRVTTKPKSPLGDRNYDSEFAKTIGRTHYDKVRDIVETTAHTKAAQVWAKYEDKIEIKPPNRRVGRAYQSSGTVYLDIADVATANSYQTAYEALFHETGHLLDFGEGVGWKQYFAQTHKNGEFLKAVKADFKKLVNAKKVQLQTELEAKIAAYDIEWLYDHDYISYTDYRRGKLPASAKVKVAHAYSALEDELRNAYSAIERANFSDVFSGYTSGKYDLGYGHSQKYWKDLGDFARSTEAFAEFFSAAIANPQSYELLKTNLPTAEKIFNELLDELIGRAQP